MIENRQARFDYEILHTIEAGIVLTGTEVKSIMSGRVGIKDAFAVEYGGEIWLQGMRVDPLPHARDGHEPLRRRKLLMHRREIASLVGDMTRAGLSVVPLSLYAKGGRYKVELGVGRGKKLHDKREAIKDREWQRRRASRDLD